MSQNRLSMPSGPALLPLPSVAVEPFGLAPSGGHRYRKSA